MVWQPSSLGQEIFLLHLNTTSLTSKVYILPTDNIYNFYKYIQGRPYGYIGYFINIRHADSLLSLQGITYNIDRTQERLSTGTGKVNSALDTPTNSSPRRRLLIVLEIDEQEGFCQGGHPEHHCRQQRYYRHLVPIGGSNRS